MNLDSLIPLIAALPLAGFIFSAAYGRRLGKQAHVVPVAAVGIAWLIAMVVVYSALTGGFGEGHTIKLWDWIPAGAFHVEAAFFVDNLTACLLIVVTTIGLLVHVYSIGYMSHDPGYWRFFAYLNLFMFSMLLLVLGDSWLTVFVAWELVGLSSYLLIGFWYRKHSAALASKKAFIVNRVGDVGFALGIMAIFVDTGTLNIRDSIAALTGHAVGTTCAVGQAACATVGPIPVWVIALLVFAGAAGKSAQFPLHVWLPDAMEGPTPVSALIHAATMVNAGVYLIARANPIFASAPQAMVVVASIGIFTAILAASIAMTQTDIKRVLAYSTLSQLGYMFAALGVGAWTAAIFHLMTHGFFKGLLFLGSGSVIHAVHEEQDMRKMGGLAKKIPQTYRTMLIGAIAIAGIPPLAGFFSKDEILGEAFKAGFTWVWAIGVLVAILTAFYMFRLIGLTFWGESRVDKDVEPNIHESPSVMTVPLWLLAIPSLVLGLILSWPGPPAGPLFGQRGPGLLARWLEPVYAQGVAILGRHEAAFALFGVDGVLILVSVAVAVIGMVIAWRLFGVELGSLRRHGNHELVRDLTARVPFLYRASLNKWWFDDLNHLLFIVIGGRVAALAWWFDVNVVDGIVNGIGSVTRRSGGGLARVQTGRVQNYALGIAIGLIVMVGSYALMASH